MPCQSLLRLPALGVGARGPASPTNITELPGLGTIPPSSNCSSSPALTDFLSAFFFDLDCQQRYIATAFYYYCFHCNFSQFCKQELCLFLC